MRIPIRPYNLLFFIALLSVLNGCARKEQSQILGKWHVVEYWAAGKKETSARHIEFLSDGTYLSSGDDLADVSGTWRIKGDRLTLYQPEIKDMHGNRIIEPFTRIWNTDVAENWMVLEGTGSSETQDMKLVLQKVQN
jgi:hypothetical protein